MTDETYFASIERLSHESIAAALADASRRREARRQLRAQLAAARDAGLRHRHAAKLAPEGQAMTKPIAPEDGPCGTTGALFDYRLSQTSTKTGRERARNRHAGTCHACGRRVPAGAGCISKSGDSWVVYC